MCETDLQDEDGRRFTPSRGQSQFFIKSVMLETFHPSPALNPDPQTIQTCRSHHCRSRGRVGDFNPSSKPFDMNPTPRKVNHFRCVAAILSGQIGSALNSSPIRYGTSPCPQSRMDSARVATFGESILKMPICLPPICAEPT